jgi:hypothetical protein
MNSNFKRIDDKFSLREVKEIIEKLLKFNVHYHRKQN